MPGIVELLIETFGKHSVLTHEAAATRVAANWKQPGNLDCLALLLPETTEQV